MFGRQDKASQDECAATLTAELLWLESMIDPAGPYFAGEAFSLVDCALLPHFLRMYILKHYRSVPRSSREGKFGVLAWMLTAPMSCSTPMTLLQISGMLVVAFLLPLMRVRD